MREQIRILNYTLHSITPVKHYQKMLSNGISEWRRQHRARSCRVCSCCTDPKNGEFAGINAGRSPGGCTTSAKLSASGAQKRYRLTLPLQIAPKSKLFLLQLRRASLLLIHRIAAISASPLLLLLLHITAVIDPEPSSNVHYRISTSPT